MRASLLSLCLVLLAGCSLLEDDGTPLDFRAATVTPTDSLQIDLLALDAISPGSASQLFLLVHSAADAERLRRATALDRTAIPDADWTRESLFVTTVRLRPDERLFVESVRLRSDRVEIEGVVQTAISGPTGERRTVVVAVALSGAPRERTGLSFRTRVNP